MAKKIILIADDEIEMREELTVILKDEGYDVRCVSDGRAAIKFIKKQKVDLMLLDLKMPVMTGFEVLRELNEMNICLRTIVLTGSILGSTLPDEKGMSRMEKERLLKFADMVINKPFDIVKLIEKINYYTA